MAAGTDLTQDSVFMTIGEYDFGRGVGVLECIAGYLLHLVGEKLWVTIRSRFELLARLLPCGFTTFC